MNNNFYNKYKHKIVKENFLISLRKKNCFKFMSKVDSK